MGKDGKPRGKMTAYAFFVQTCREEHRKKYPGEQIVFADFSKRCAEKWKVKFFEYNSSLGHFPTIYGLNLQ